MPLPILQTHATPSPEALIRFFHQTERHWMEHMAEATQLDTGTAFANPSLANVHDANRILDAALTEGISPEQALQEVAEHYVQQGSRCWSWVMNPSAEPERTVPLVEHLQARGYRRSEAQILYLHRLPTSAIEEVGGLTIIPQRASFRHTRLLAEEAAQRWNEPQLAEAAMSHLDDPSWDALLALRDGVPVGKIGVLSAGEIGRIENVYVARDHRGQGIGRTLMSRALEICARSLFKHIFISCTDDNEPAMALYGKIGFREVGRFTAYDVPD